ncbi:MAG: hypothetical protein NC078_08010 [Ruminococcus sp.]|nr:hypothetical protein [Ruminococcus sp.]
MKNYEFEKAAYNKAVLLKALAMTKAVAITARRKECHYPIYFELKRINEYLQDHSGNSCYFYSPYRLENYRNAVGNHYRTTTKKELDRMARLAKEEMKEMIQSIFRDAKEGSLILK